MNTIIPINRNGIFLLLAALLVISAGCIADQPQANATPALPTADTSSSQTPGTAISPVQATITPMIAATPSPAANIASFSDHGSVNVLRGKPFTIAGTVPDKTMTAVQVWLLNRSVTTLLVPVKADGTFSVTLDDRHDRRSLPQFFFGNYRPVPGPAGSFRGKLRPGLWADLRLFSGPGQYPHSGER
jgi:hypothetical protein